MDTNILIGGKYLVDTAKFIIDKDLFAEVNIPNRFILSNADTGEVLSELKKSSFQIAYKGDYIYLANVSKTLGNNRQQKIFIEKVFLWFSPKVFGEKYFGGITKEGMIEVLEFLRESGYLIFDDVKKIFKGIYVKDLDIKIDRLLKPTDRDKIDEYYKGLKERFNGSSDDWHYFNNKKQGFGIGMWERSKSKWSKPYSKFYDKNAELKSQKNNDFYNSLSQEARDEISKYFIWRYEFTMKDNEWFKKHNISNRFEDILYVSQSKWNEIGLWFLKQAFDKQKRFIDKTKMSLDERTKMGLILWLHRLGQSKGAIRSYLLQLAKDKQEKYRQGKRFDRYWTMATTPNQYSADMYARMENISKWDRYIGLI